MVNIETHKGSYSKDTGEYQYAENLTTIFKSYFDIRPQVSGDIFITTSFLTPGEDVEDIDIAIFARFDNFILPGFYTNDDNYSKRDLQIKNLCCNIELKQTQWSDIQRSGTQIRVNYRSTSKRKDAYHQMEQGSTAIHNYYTKKTKKTAPFFQSILWLAGINQEQADSLRNGDPLRILPNSFSFEQLLDTIFLNNKKKPYWDRISNRYIFNAIGTYDDPQGNLDYFDDLKKMSKEEIQLAPGITRRKMDIIQANAKSNIDISSIGEKTTLAIGLPGTGKTFDLLIRALKVINEKNANCLMLTYNKALVSDIRRLLFFMGMPKGSDDSSLHIQSMEQYFLQLMVEWGIVDSGYIDPIKYTNNRLTWMDKLSNDIQKFLEDNHKSAIIDCDNNSLSWDYVFIDEGQDWHEIERKVIFQLFGKKNVVVADGVNQFVRSGQHLDWTPGEKPIINKNGLRQSVNLTLFANNYANRFINGNSLFPEWKITPSTNIQKIGGKVIITNMYSQKLHSEITKDCREHECENYDILFLVPPQDVKHDNGRSSCIWTEPFLQNGIQVFDGTDPKDRESYSIDSEECRLYQYDSCRGLEAWATVCLDFDLLISHKLKNDLQITPDSNDSYTNVSERQKKYAYLWSLMPLTRPINTLVITLDNVDSEVGRFLIECSKEIDYVDYYYFDENHQDYEIR